MVAFQTRYPLCSQEVDMRGIGWQEILLFLVILLLLFGATKLPQLARALGKSLNEFKKGKEEGDGPDKPDEIKQDQTGTTPGKKP